jgi:hypothetical protein
VADATYNPSVYRKQGGNELVIASGGTITTESGGYVKKHVTTRAVADVATAIPLGSICGVVASTTGPVYKLATPVAGAEIVVTLTAQTSNVGAKVYSGSTGVAMATSGPNQLTLVGANQTAVFHGVSATRWYVTKNTSIAFSAYTS